MADEGKDRATEPAGWSRRQFLKAGALGVAGVCSAVSLNATSPDATGETMRPNIIFINVDQMSGENTISAFGCPHVRTPNIDRIIANGVSFRRSYAADPICCPARTSWWTGRYPSEHGVFVNNIPCHRELPDLGPLLSENGYEAFHIGKWHVPGIDVRKSFHVSHRSSWWGEITDPDTTRAAKAFLRNYTGQKPFFLALGYLNPHDICLTWNQHQGSEIPHLVELGALDAEDLPPLPAQHDYDEREPAVLRMMKRSGGLARKLNGFTELQWRHYLWNYYRHIEMVDHQIGLVLDEVEGAPFKEQTLIILASDHGEGMACHGLVGKSALYDETVRVPLVVATLGDKLAVRKGMQDSSHLISGVDFLPTVCDYAGIEPFRNAGMSIRPMVEGHTPEAWREWVYAESTFYMRMICSRRYKYVTEYVPEDNARFMPAAHQSHRLGVEQLFDLENDPGETQSLAYDSDYQDIVARHREHLFNNEAQLERKPITHRSSAEQLTRITDRIRKGDYPQGYEVR